MGKLSRGSWQKVKNMSGSSRRQALMGMPETLSSPPRAC